MNSADTCPKCRGREFDGSGNCTACGQPPQPEAEPGAAKQPSGLIEIDYSEAQGGPGAELPQWRIELSRRLQEIKLRRETTSPGPPPAEPGPVSPGQPSPVEMIEAQRAPLHPVANVEESARKDRPPRSPRRTPKFPAVAGASGAAGSQMPAQAPSPLADLPLFKSAEGRPEPGGEARTPAAGIQELIDRAVSEQAARETPSLPPVPARPAPAAGAESRLILLTRTLSGLVDLVLIVACTLGFLVAADVFSGIEVLDRASLFTYGALLAAVYLVYSLFFLLTSNQTIGMMMTELRLEDAASARPAAARVVARTLLYPGALLLLGLGLVWGLADRRSRCLHDILSGTRVTRLSGL